MRIGGHLEARVRQQETADFGEAGVDVSADILELLVLVLFHLQSFIQEAPPSLQAIWMFIRVTPISD